MTIGVTLSPDQVVMCPSGTATFTANPYSGVPPYSYSWNSLNWGSWQTIATTSSPSLVMSGSQLLANSVSELSVTVKDSRGCWNPSPLSAISVNKGFDEWGAYDFFTNFVSAQPALPNTDIIHESIGLPYYVGQDNQIYYYKYVTTPYVGWKNLSITGTSAAGPLGIYESGNNKTIYYSDILNNLKLTSITFNNITNSWASSVPLTTTPVGGSIKIDNTGNVFFRSTDNKIYSSVNSYAAPIVSVQPDSEFDITGTIMYYINTAGNIAAAKYDGTAVSLTGWSPAALAGTNVKTDDNGNAYFVGSDHIIYQVSSSGAVGGTTWALNCNGKFSINKATSVIYAAGTDLNIYQIFYKNGWWQTLEISYWLARPSQPISTVDGFQQAGSVDFRSPNTFYVAEDGLVKLILYNTTAYCQPAQLKIAYNQNKDDDFLPEGSNTSIENEVSKLKVYPNPFSENASVAIEVENDGWVSLTIYNGMGEKVNTILKETALSKGEYTYGITGKQLPQGIYFLQYSKDGAVIDTKKLNVQ